MKKNTFQAFLRNIFLFDINCQVAISTIALAALGWGARWTLISCLDMDEDGNVAIIVDFKMWRF